MTVYHIDVHTLREQLNQLESRMLSAPTWRIDGRWWDRCEQRRLELRKQIITAKANVSVTVK